MPTTRGRGDYITTGDKLTLRFGSSAQDKKPVTIEAGNNNAGITLTLPSTGGEVVTDTSTATLTGKRLDAPKINEDVVLTSTATELNQLDGVTVGGDAVGDIVTTNAGQTLTNKTLTSPILNGGDALTATSTELNQIAGVSVGGNAAGDIVTIDDVQTLTNKSIDASANTISNIKNGNIDNNANIADTKLDTISTAGKVANSATTATNANTPSAIVSRDASGNFSAGTITAAIVGNASTATTLQTSRSIALSGELSGSTSFNGSADVFISATVVDNVIDNANIKSDAGIARTKVAAGTANHVLINDGSGVLSSEAQLSISRGGTGASTASVAFNTLSPLTTKGDIIAYNGSGNVRLPAGANNYVLTADSAADSGVTWKAAADTDTLLVGGADTQVQYNDNGNLGASSSFTYDASLGKLYLKGINTSSSSYILETRNSVDDILFRISNDGGITGKNIAAKSDGVKLGLDAAKNAITTSEYVAIGNNAGKSTTFYNAWTAVGYNAAADCVDATTFTAVGYNASRYLRATEQFVAIGYNAGTYATTPSTNLQYNTNGTFIGSSTKGTDGGSFSTRTVNETVIGYAAIGNGSNTVTIGNSSVTNNYFRGNISTTGNLLSTGLVVSNSINSSVSVTDTTNVLKYIFPEASGPASFHEVSRDGTTLALKNNTSVKIYDIESATLLQTISFNAYLIRFSEDAEVLVVSNFFANSNTGQVDIYRKVSGTWGLEQTLLGQSAGNLFGKAIEISYNGNEIYIGDNPGNVYVYERSGGTWTLSQTLAPPSGSSNVVQISTDGYRTWLVVTYSNNAVIVYNYVIGIFVWQFNQDVTPTPITPQRAAVSKFGETIVVGSSIDNKLCILNYTGVTWELTQTFENIIAAFGDRVVINDTGTKIAATKNISSFFTLYEFNSGNWSYTNITPPAYANSPTLEYTILAASSDFSKVVVGKTASPGNSLIYDLKNKYKALTTNGLGYAAFDGPVAIGESSFTPEERLHVKGNIQLGSAKLSSSFVELATSGSTIVYDFIGKSYGKISGFVQIIADGGVEYNAACEVTIIKNGNSSTYEIVIQDVAGDDVSGNPPVSFSVSSSTLRITPNASLTVTSATLYYKLTQFV